ncbi:phage tail protein, partial [Lacticaseibacillus rhamnosus]
VDVATTAWNGIKSFVTSLWNGIVNTAKNIWNALPGFFSGLLNGIKNTMSNIWNGIKNAAIGFMQDEVRGLKAIWDGLVTIVTNVVNGIKKGFNALKNIDLLAAGRAIMDSFFKGLKAVWGKITDFVGGIASWIRKHKGPISYDAKLLIPAGNAIMNGLNAGLTDKFSDVQKNVSSMAQAIVDSAAVTMPEVNTSPFDASLQSLNNSVQGATLSSNLDVNYTRKQTIEVPLYIDGREVARATANPMQTELNRLTKVSNYRKGLV